MATILQTTFSNEFASHNLNQLWAVFFYTYMRNSVSVSQIEYDTDKSLANNTVQKHGINTERKERK